MARSAYMTELVRSVRGSLGRFLAIMCIVALGCGFYAGLRMCGPDMRAAADRWYDGSALWDLRVVSTKGLSDAQVERLSKVKGVSQVMASRTADVVCKLGSDQVAVRVTSVDADAARKSKATSAYAVSSSKGSYLNRARLVSGRWPKAAGECVVSADATHKIKVSSTIEVVSASEDVSTILSTTKLKVVGTVSSPDYPYTGSFGSTRLGSGTIGQYAFVTASTFAADYPYTDAYLTVGSARSAASGSSAYESAVDKVKDRVEKIEGSLAADRLAELKSQAQSQLDAQVAAAQAAAAQAASAGASTDLSAAQQQLAAAQEQVDSMAAPDVYTLDRSQSEGAATYEADTERLDRIATVFPAMFFLVAALVALTTMTRIVDDDRQRIGTHKALGYGKGRIAAMYLGYALLASGLGAVLGICVLTQVLPRIVMDAYSVIYVVPTLEFPLPVDVGTALAAGGLGVGVTLASTLVAVAASLAEVPAALLRPRAPKAGKRILLERVRPLWRRLSFSWKVTFRNLFRYKRRLLMTLAGIAGCSALLLVGFGLHDSIWDIIDRQFGPIVRYNATVTLADGAAQADVDSAIACLRSKGDATGIVRVHTDTMLARGTGSSSAATDKTRVSVVVPQTASKLASAVTLRDRTSGAAIAFGQDSVVVTEKLASLYGIRAGDTIVLYRQDDVGNATGKGVRLKVDAVAENYVGNYVYVGRRAWRRAMGATPSFSTVYARVTGGSKAESRTSDALHDIAGVSTVSFTRQTISTYRHTLSVVDMVVVVLIVSAGALAFIVLYNLTNINVSERVREIASLRVLGFTRREVHAYVYREIAIIALLGDALGMLLGSWLERFVITTAEVDYVMFGREIHPLSFAFAFALAMAFTVAILLLMRPRLDRVDMVESLKSVD
jgi:ABC-type antimicrobial peptide transport system permease subunit